MTTPDPRDAALARVHATHARVRDARIAVDALVQSAGGEHPAAAAVRAAAADLAGEARTDAATAASTGTAAGIDALADRIGEAADALDALLLEAAPVLLPRPRDRARLAAREALHRHVRPTREDAAAVPGIVAAQAADLTAGMDPADVARRTRDFDAPRED